MAPLSAVLIIEDDLPIQQLLTMALRRRQLAPVCAGDGRTGLDLLLRDEFGAILLDLLLPEMNGFEVLRHIACARSALLARVIVITAAHESLWRDCPYIPRTRKLMRKPFDMAALERDIMACCSQ